MVHRKLVPEENIQEGDMVTIWCAHGDTVLYLFAKVSQEVEGCLIEAEAAVSDTLPISVLLGMDTPELTELLQGDQKTEAVITRASRGHRRQNREVQQARVNLQSTTKAS